MASPTGVQTALLDEIEHHVAALSELLEVYDYGLRNALRRRDRRLIRTLTHRIAFTTKQLEEAQRRRDRLRRELQSPVG